MRVCVLGSGSSGNCTYIETSRTRLLVDAGFGPRSLARRLNQAGLPTDRFDALLITHGHIDHYGGAASFVKRFRAPVFSNSGTRHEVAALEELDRWEAFQNGVPFTIGDLTVEAFSVSHDCADPVGFRIAQNGYCGAVVTDLGEMTPSVEQKLRGCDWMVVESNHDEEMLRLGAYPFRLKQRLTSRLGHLSNRAFARFLRDGFDGRARHIFLAHLSRNNNHPDIALETARQGLVSRSRQSFHDLWDPVRLHLTDQVKPSIVVSL